MSGSLPDYGGWSMTLRKPHANSMAQGGFGALGDIKSSMWPHKSGMHDD